MKSTRWKGWSLASLLFLTLTSIGCQTWVAGMTLPSPHYLDHPPQYFPPDPPFPYEKELASMEAAIVDQGVPGVPQRLPAQLPQANP